MGKSRSVSEQVTGFIKQAEAGTPGQACDAIAEEAGHPHCP